MCFAWLWQKFWLSVVWANAYVCVKGMFDVIANFKQVIKEGDLRIHPLITRLVDPETLQKMGAAPVAKTEDA